MNNKYIIELTPDCVKDEYLRIPARIAGEQQWIMTKAALTPYTEPNLEQIREEAYLKGLNDGKGVILESTQNNAFNNGYKKCLEDMEQVRKEAYEDGLKDAWEAAKKIALMDTETSENVTGYFGLFRIMDNLTASEAIAKIKEYEDGKQEYHIGDEFENGAGQKFVVLKMDGKEIDRYIDSDGKTYVMNVKYGVMRKTGRSFPEIATVLEKMRGDKE